MMPPIDQKIAELIAKIDALTLKVDTLLARPPQQSDVVSIMGQSLDGYNAILKLKGVEIKRNEGTCVQIYTKNGSGVMIESDVGDAIDIGAYRGAGMTINSVGGVGLKIEGSDDALQISGGVDGIDIDATRGNALSLNGGTDAPAVKIDPGEGQAGIHIMGGIVNE